MHVTVKCLVGVFSNLTYEHNTFSQEADIHEAELARAGSSHSWKLFRKCVDCSERRISS